MTASGLLQIALYFLVLLALTKPLGLYMNKVFRASVRSCTALCGPRSCHLQTLRNRRERRAALDALRWRHSSVLGHDPAGHLRVAAHSAVAAVEPTGIGADQPRFVLQHGHELHHQH